ncbi:MAG: hypothetical protein O3A95_06645 [Planctomycetota bacterium]|nr:hypothetical protein [Planctomycetota bacterium]MDA1113960.1 hypothetical protein [Planctomycetota bacterium]
MKASLAPLLLLVAASSCSLTFGGWGEKVTSESTLHFEPAAGTTSINIDCFNGSIELLAGTEGSAIDGKSTLHARGRTTEHAQERLRTMEWQFSQSGDAVTLILTKPEGGSNNAGGKLQSLSVPTGYDITIDTSNGHVTIPAGFENLHIDTGNGAVTIHGGKKVYVDTSNGRIEYFGSSPDFELNTSNGSIEVQLEGNWNGRGVADSSNGRIAVRCNGVIDARLHTSTSNGKPVVYGPELGKSAGAGSLDLDTSNGNITVTHAFAD